MLALAKLVTVSAVVASLFLLWLRAPVLDLINIQIWRGFAFILAMGLGAASFVIIRQPLTAAAALGIGMVGGVVSAGLTTIDYLPRPEIMDVLVGGIALWRLEVCLAISGLGLGWALGRRVLARCL